MAGKEEHESMETESGTPLRRSQRMAKVDAASLSPSNKLERTTRTCTVLDKSAESSPEARKLAFPKTCEICDGIFRTAKKFTEHMRGPTACASAQSPLHTASPRKYPRTCDDCGQVFAVKYKYHDHRKSFAPCNGVPKDQQTKRSEEKFTCELCGSVLVDKKGLAKHTRLIHPETVPEEKRGAEVYPCRYCDRVFHRHNSRSYHEVLHKNEKRLTCEVCGSACASASKLKRHALLHSEESLRCPGNASRECHFIMEDLAKFHLHCDKIHPGEQLEPVKNVPKVIRNPTGQKPPQWRRRRKSASVPSVVLAVETRPESDDSDEATTVLGELAVEGEEDVAKENRGQGDAAADSKLQFMKMVLCAPCNVVFMDYTAVVEHMMQIHGDILQEIEVGGIH